MSGSNTNQAALDSVLLMSTVHYLGSVSVWIPPNKHGLTSSLQRFGMRDFELLFVDVVNSTFDRLLCN